MKRMIAAGGVMLVTGLACAEPTGWWHFEDGKAGDQAGVVASAVNTSVLAGKAGVFEKGTPPVFDMDVPHKELWDGLSCKPVVPADKGSLRFGGREEPGGGVPVGGEVVIAGKDALIKPAGFTIEAFVKVAKKVPHHALIASKRRNGQSGTSWSLSITPQGRLGVRFDTQPGAQNSGEGFNQCFSSSALVNDGQWHHVALTYDRETQKADLYVDYKPCGGGKTSNPLVYDDSDMVFGRGLDGWLDEVRLSPEVLHFEQFLRPTRFFSDMKQQVPVAIPLLDQTPTRVQSALKPELKRIGNLIPKSIKEIETTMWSLGCETLDRDLANWDVYRGYLVPLGIKRIRLQGGWNRTEKEKGIYNFDWLDHIVDDAIGLGMEVCLETSYNNKLYEPGGALGPGGKLPEGDETMAAWDKWVEAMVRRYSARGVKEWMMYNEPNLNKENSLEDIVANNIRTAAIIKRVDPQAKVGAFVLAGLGLSSIEKMLTMIKEQGKQDLFQWAIYHGYSGNPDRLNENMVKLTEMMKTLTPKMHAWQGEAGCASEEVQYALSGIDWTEYSHAKWNTRRMLCDVGCGIESSVFTISDISYSKDFISRYGLLKTNPDNSIIKVKTAYYSVQNVVTIFNDSLERVPNYDMTITGTDKELTRFAFRDKKSGLDVVTLWDGTEIPSNGSEIEKVQVTIKGGHFKDPVWVDLITGDIYTIPAEQFKNDGGVVTFKDVPVYDGPATIMDKSLLKFMSARESKPKKNARKNTPPKQTKVSAVPMAQYLLPGTQQPAPAVLILGKKDETTAGLVKWLNEQAVHAFIFETDGNDSPDTTLRKVRDALSYVRSRSAEWQVKNGSIGVMCVKAKGELAARVIVANTDFTILLDSEVSDVEKSLKGTKRLFVGTKDTWKEPLAKWLEQFKGKVF